MENDYIRDVIRLSFNGSLFKTTNEHKSPPQGDSPRQKLVDGIIFSRKLILTYHVVILAGIFVLSISHWSKKLSRWRRRRAMSWHTSVHNGDGAGEITGKTSAGTQLPVQDSDDISSSGSSTLEGNSSPPRKDVDEDEQTSLLPRRTRPSSKRWSVVSSVEGMLMYQTRPIPYINKTLPSNGSSIVILSFLGLNIFYCLFHLEFNIGFTFVIADRLGTVFIANLPLLYLLAAKNQPLKFLTGRSYESLNILHRRLGELLCFIVVFHGTGMVIVWYTLLRPRGLNFLYFLSLPVIIFGLGALASYEFLYFTSLGSFRQRWYELFLASHIVLQIAGLVFLYFHHSIDRPYVFIALGVFLIDRLVYRFGVKSTTVTAKAKLMEDEETVKLSVSIPMQSGFRLSRLLGKDLKSGWEPTDHVFVTISALGKEHLLQAHPFTISSAAPTLDSPSIAANLELLIRSQSGFSRDLLHYVHRHSTLTLRLDGPYGSSHARDLLTDSSLALVIAGGSGIAVAWPLIEHLIYLSTINDTESGRKVNAKPRKIILVWVVHQAAHMSWLSPHDIAVAKQRGVEIITPTATEEAGRPDLKGLIEGFVEKHHTDGGRTGVVASGPDGMGRLVRNTCSGLVRNGEDLDVVIEKFGW